MKALVVVDEHTYSYKGEIYLREFGHILIKRYLNIFEEVRMVARNKKVQTKEELKSFNIPIEDPRIDFFSVPFFQGPKEYVLNYFKVQKTLQTVCEGCELAIVRIPSTIGFSTINLIRRKNISFAVEVVASQKQRIKGTKNWVDKFLRYITHKQQLRACQEAIGIAYVTKSFLQKDYPIGEKTKFQTHYSSVELSEILFQGVRTFQKSKSIVLCHISHPIASFSKGYREAIQVTKELNDRGHHVLIKFAGDGPLVSQLKGFATSIGIQDQVVFSGLLDKESLLRMLKESDLMILPSRSEGLPRVLIEASATGLPAVSTPVGGIPEIISQELLFEPDDIMGFTDKIEEIFTHPEYFEEISAKAFEKAERYSVENLTKKRNEFYTHLKNYVIKSKSKK